MQDKKGLVKRTKSFWKFGKNSSDNEILEGMSLWKHRDLVDVPKTGPKNTEKLMNAKNTSKSRKSHRDHSNDSDRTINAKQTEENNRKLSRKYSEKTRHRTSFTEKQKLSLPPRKASNEKQEEIEKDFKKPAKRVEQIDDQFYDDGDDGLMLRTVNRKNILQQYTNDSTGPDSESESEITSDDPYDCIVVDDQAQKVKKNGEKYPDVHAIGKKLEKLSKSSKYSPHVNEKSATNNSNNSHSNIIEKNNSRNDRKNIEQTVEDDNLSQYNKRHSFKTFGIGIDEPNNDTGEEERRDNDIYYTENIKRGEISVQDKRRYYAETNSSQRRPRNYEPTESEIGRQTARNSTNRSNSESEKKDKLKYYSERHRESTVDEFSDATESRQFLPRTKLHKTNSNGSNNKYDTEGSLMEYGETLKRRMKSPEHGDKFDEKSPHSGNMYGPWYDLWGLDASVRK